MNEIPKGELTLQILAMPKDTNPGGDIFGGWLLSQMDIAGGIFCQKVAKGRVVTVTIDSITFKKPVFIGDTVSCHVQIIKIGRSSMVVQIETWAKRQYDSGHPIKVTEGVFKYVKIDQFGNPEPIYQSS